MLGPAIPTAAALSSLPTPLYPCAPTSGSGTPTTADGPGAPTNTCTALRHYPAPISYNAPDDPRGLFLGDPGLETISGDSLIAFFTSTINDGADVHAVRLTQ